MLRLTARLRQEYRALFSTCHVRDGDLAAVDALVDRILDRRPRYEGVVEGLGGENGNMPWFFVAIVHSLESGLRFDHHLHNGDPLGARTVRVPAGHPRAGEPPFLWEESAADALRLQSLHRWSDWSGSGLLYRLERYNGFGYRMFHPEVLSPYLWSKTEHYERGKYTADGVFSATTVSSQVGGAALLRRLLERLLVEPLAPDEDEVAAPGPRVLFAADEEREDARRLQRFLNGFHGVYLRVDGRAGLRTSEGFRAVTGHWLPGDPRAGSEEPA